MKFEVDPFQKLTKIYMSLLSIMFTFTIISHQWIGNVRYINNLAYKNTPTGTGTKQVSHKHGLCKFHFRRTCSVVF